MRALSILQPWAWLIVTGQKDIENRTWPTRFRGRILVHAGKRWPKGEEADDREDYLGMPGREQMVGGIVGAVTIVECVSSSSSKWFNGPWGFVLRDAERLPFTPWRGQLGFFDIPNASLPPAKGIA